MLQEIGVREAEREPERVERALRDVKRTQRRVEREQAAVCPELSREVSANQRELREQHHVALSEEGEPRRIESEPAKEINKNWDEDLGLRWKRLR